MRLIENALMAIGLLLLVGFLGAHLDRALFAKAAIANFPSTHLQRNAIEAADPKPDFRLWLSQRVKNYEKSLTISKAPILGILRVPKIQLEAAILNGTDAISLNRGVGRIAGTAELNQDGNIGLAGHRDGFFRKLKDIRPGDKIEIVSGTRTRTYVVDRVMVVDPDHVIVLQPRSQPSLTLVTCYPFYFVGSAPKRYVVQASLSDPSSKAASALAPQRQDPRESYAQQFSQER